ncbi:MAG: O-methyltransferase [Alphaproteobacteria bacterium]|nr:O-methyltransferase [Alphaproteobacteria bacterium]
MAEPLAWSAVDGFIADRLLGLDAALETALARNAAEGLPAIDVSPAQGRFLQVLAALIGARRILEVGALGGYSAICLARALPPDGRLISLEIDPRHARTARANIAHAGLSDRIEVRLGPALDSLTAMSRDGDGPFDLVFIDADKPNNAAYFAQALRLARPGAAILIDNVIRGGRVLESDGRDANVAGARAAFAAVAEACGGLATALQTVGVKGWDGLIIARAP